MSKEISRKVYSKQDGKLKCTEVTGFTGCDRTDSGRGYMEAVRVSVGGENSNSAFLICLNGGKQ